MTIALIGFAVLMLLILLRMPIAFAMGVVGFIGYAALGDWNFNGALTVSAKRLIDTAQDYGLSVIPMFILMGNLLTRAGMSQELYRVCHAFLGHYRGGLAMATVAACGCFSAISGSSLATSATMAKVAMPAMRSYGYSDGLASASIAAGGTLGILIPPSVILIIYGVLTEQSIRDLFAAGFIPGILGIFFYLLATKYVVWRKPSEGPKGEKVPFNEKITALKSVTGVVGLFLLVIGGIYLGIFTPTEAAGVGAGGAFLIALYRRSLSIPVLKEILIDTARTSTMLFGVIIGALIYSNFVNRAGLPNELVNWLGDWDVEPIFIILAIIGIYILLGTVFESLSMLLLTVPIFYPLVASLGLDLVWFGIVVVVVTEISLITPPVGLNVFVLSSVVKDIKTSTIFKGVTPFWCADILRLLLLIFIPALSLWLPSIL
ncbi:TRAP-type C4-dicarboxylate transport system, large permease component [Vibrio cincinnatiensis]|jgi:tripartite ATP-independent transporter DctM subunit|uniref:TRAP transporter large permease protein n=1 Tax=Vibrio cincinnatiensis DSM 19608 TaxID=1123491 RepID=A0A1T4RVA3_VIBCI|nr:TRAP transporter large permease [Vibrio cincinnatiensis]SKA19919.1 TRAP transporter, DctM subunit [Vibrio cincinnatiensis DSM 19608]SUP49043.1 TRAP-type C4-dicarboxylate transport system, large permease component [Vibrio cincinnatiensis]